MSHQDRSRPELGPVTIDAHPAGCVFQIWVVPGARRAGIVGPHDGALKVRVAAPAERGRANREAVALLGEALDAPVELIGGDRGRRKSVLVRGRDPGWVGKAVADIGRGGDDRD